MKINKNSNNSQQIQHQAIDHAKLEGRGGAFLVTPVDKGKVFSRELFCEEHAMFREAVVDFSKNQIQPIKDELNHPNEVLTRSLIQQMGELGFLSTDFPESVGGLATDKITSIIVSESLMEGQNASIIVTFADHTGIGTLPIIWYGNEAQKQKYLPKLASGEWIGSFALTEPGAGSDALAGTTKATLNKEGTHYLLNGSKIFVTNGGWAEVCVTFAWVDGNKFTAFILDKECTGWVLGPEEHKLGIKGSSTCTFFYEDCKVPIENVIGKVGLGSAVAFNVLYVGRYKLGATTMGGAKKIITLAHEYATERKQFDRPIREFGMIRRKLAKMMVRAWEADTILYMTAGSLDSVLSNYDKESAEYYSIVQKTIEDHGIEASICKIIGSEAASDNIDDCLQIFGGNGFIEDYPIATIYRDDRINRIFEGTNEINRLIIGGTLLKKSILEDLPVREAISNRKNHWIPERKFSDHNELNTLARIIEFSRSLLLYTLNEGIISEGQDLKNNEWVLEPLANMVISLSIMDAGFKRSNNLTDDADKKHTFMNIFSLVVHDRFEKMVSHSKIILSHLDSKDNVSERIDYLEKKCSEIIIRYSPIESMEYLVKKLDHHKKYFLDD
ncbi:MAG: acyl-CoA dehydrogenase family protein [Candidatus Marinimicrobia bacterium]|nr:acyl-CoA dehydrogenase family protein [Candidatus Neomarinimicrobiota bacterium]